MNRSFQNKLIKVVLLCIGLNTAIYACADPKQPAKPNIILLMTDDQVWFDHTLPGPSKELTPNFADMIKSGLLFERFYAGAPVCSPSRATFLTGRSNDRTGVLGAGYALRQDEITIAELVKKHGYNTAFFGKWHLNGVSGPGVPVLADDPFHPGKFGFDYWLASTNYFDRDPLLGDMGAVKSYQGSSSSVLVHEALKYVDINQKDSKPMFLVVWFPDPHRPWDHFDPVTQMQVLEKHNTGAYFSELKSLDDALGDLRKGIAERGLSEKTLLWFMSDNGGHKKIKQTLKGRKGTFYEGGIRVPGVVEWKGVIEPRIEKNYPASLLDILPTIAELAGEDVKVLERPLDGESLMSIFRGEKREREKSIPFRMSLKDRGGALISGQFKLVVNQREESNDYELYNLVKDPYETNNLSVSEKDLLKKMIVEYEEWSGNVDLSLQGLDYKGKKYEKPTAPVHWQLIDRYKNYLGN